MGGWVGGRAQHHPTRTADPLTPPADDHSNTNVVPVSVALSLDPFKTGVPFWGTKPLQLKK